MRETVVRTLIRLAKENRNIELVTGDLGFQVLKPFWEELPDQFTNAGIAEQNMTTMAAGMAMEGKTVFTYSIGNFPTLRCLEQIRNDCAYHGANVKIICVGGFAYGALGVSHQATEDMAIMRALPGMVVMAPCDKVEAAAAVMAIAEYPGTCYLRLGRGGEKRVHEKIENFAIGKAVPVRRGDRVSIFSTGAIFDEVEAACAVLEEAGIQPTVYTFPTVKPIDRATILDRAGSDALIVTVEEHNVAGGFGSAVAEVMAEAPGRARLLRMGLQDEYGTQVGDQKYLRSRYGISGAVIARSILERLK